jgi:hypothetical protein
MSDEHRDLLFAVVALFVIAIGVVKIYLASQPTLMTISHAI